MNGGERNGYGGFDYTHQLHFHVIPFNETEARKWSEQAQVPFDQVKRIMKAQQASTYRKKIEKIVSIMPFFMFHSN